MKNGKPENLSPRDSMELVAGLAALVGFMTASQPEKAAEVIFETVDNIVGRYKA